MANRSFPSGLYGITDPSLLSSDNLLQGVRSALEGGCKIIQYRNKQANKTQQLREATELANLCKAHQALFIVNDNIELALESHADGVHLGKTDGDINTARSLLGKNRFIGVTCHSDLAYARQCIAEGVDYCAFGRFFPSKTKPKAPHCPLSLLSEARQLPVPVVAIGGITIDNMPSLMDTPPNNIAVIHGLFGQTNIYDSAKQLSTAFLSLTSAKLS